MRASSSSVAMARARISCSVKLRNGRMTCTSRIIDRKIDPRYDGFIMLSPSHARRLARYTRRARAAAVAVAVLALLVFAGWTFDVEVLRSAAPGFTAMNPGGTALAFLAAAASLW